MKIEFANIRYEGIFSSENPVFVRPDNSAAHNALGRLGALKIIEIRTRNRSVAANQLSVIVESNDWLANDNKQSTPL